MQQVRQEEEEGGGGGGYCQANKEPKGWTCVITLARNKITSDKYACSALMKSFC